MCVHAIFKSYFSNLSLSERRHLKIVCKTVSVSKLDQDRWNRCPKLGWVLNFGKVPERSLFLLYIFCMNTAFSGKKEF